MMTVNEININQIKEVMTLIGNDEYEFVYEISRE